MNKIILIGVESPCSQCKMIENIIEGKLKEFQIDVKVRYIAYSDTDTKDIRYYPWDIGLQLNHCSIN